MGKRVSKQKDMVESTIRKYLKRVRQMPELAKVMTDFSYLSYDVKGRIKNG